MNMSHREHFLKAADEMRRAMSEFLEAWSQVLREYPDLSNAINEGYPFGKDFEELLMDVHSWYHKLKVRLKPSPLEWRPRKPRG